MNQSVSLIYCEQCHGLGCIGVTTCRACGGRGLGHTRHGKFLYWNYPLDGYHIVFRSTERGVHACAQIGLFLATVGIGIGFYFGLISQEITIGLVIGLVMVIVSRFIRHAPVYSEVIRHGFINDEQEDRAPHSWQEIRHLKKDEVQNISTAFTTEALQTLERAYGVAVSLHAPAVTIHHLFSAILDTSDGATVFLRLIIPIKEMKKRIASLLHDEGSAGLPYIHESVWNAVFEAYERAWSARESRVGVVDLLQAVVDGDETVRDVLFDVGVKPESIHQVIEWVRIVDRIQRGAISKARGSRGRNSGDTNRSMTAIATPFLNSFSTDITRESWHGYTEPMVGRESEIESIFRILQGGGMSVLLVGEHGVGKRAIVHGIADLMIGENVPAVLQDKRLVELDVPRLLSGVNASEAQERLLTVLHEIEMSGNIILVIPSIEKMIGISGGGSQSLDVASVLAQELGKRSFLTIATTTPGAFSKVIANQEIGTVFQRVMIDEMDVNSAIQVVCAKAGYIEYKQSVWMSYLAIEHAVVMSQRYMHDSVLPHKAIEICNEVALHVRNKRGASSLVTPEDVSEIIAEKTKIPVTAVSEDEGEKLMRLESAMHARVVGQDEAVTLVANALRRSRAELRSGKRPIANFLFLGPTGVGKTELTKTIAEVYFGNEQQMIRLDMSEYQDAQAIYRLIGRPGEQGTGLLTEAVRQKPFSLVLLDEIEKADPNILNLFLQVMDDGRLTDSVGRVIDFTNVIVIATSNAGTSFVQEQMRLGATSDHIKNQLIHGELKSYFRPEFLNRFDAIVLFQPLTQEQIGKVARIMLSGIARKLEDRGIFVDITEEGVASLAAAGFDPEFGARPLRRVIQDRVENAIAGLLLQNQVKRKDTIVIDAEGVHVRE